ncbi:MAG: DHH family phosphoesterase [Candidatus Riflebacteria bacterium]|nr:DHH family phosphoesterase [Candidatus Riflebacteria bacterium]
MRLLPGQVRAAWRRRVRRRLGRLLEVLARGRRLLVMTHDNPDPDSIASALALQKLARERAGIDAVVGHGGIVGRGENRAMLDSLSIGLVHKVDIDWKAFDLFALVDTQPQTGNNSLPAEVHADVVVDHHPIRAPTRSVAFHDVRRSYGATSTILAEYLLAAKIVIDPSLATALFYAIKSETQSLGRESSVADKRVYMRLFPLIDSDCLWRIEHSPLAPSYFTMLVDAIRGTRVHGDLAVGGLGHVAVPDMIPEFADLIMRLRGIRWAFCFGQFRGDLYLSLRTSDRAADAGTLIQRIVGADGRAGGHGMIAGGKIPGTSFAECGRLEMEAQLCRRLLEFLCNPDSTGVVLTEMDRPPADAL